MKNILLVSALVAASTTALAADLKPYIEGQVSYVNTSSVDSKTLNGVEDGITYTNAKIKLDYDNEFGYGAEIGVKDVLPNVRLGASFTTVKLDFDSAKLSGSLTDGTTTISGSAKVTSADFASVGVDMDSRVKVYMVNAYYDFANASPVTPFVGVGVGMADINGAKDNELALSASLGARYAINQNLYLGAKASYIQVDGPNVDGIKVKDVDLYTANLMLGYEF